MKLSTLLPLFFLFSIFTISIVLISLIYNKNTIISFCIILQINLTLIFSWYSFNLVFYSFIAPIFPREFYFRCHFCLIYPLSQPVFGAIYATNPLILSGITFVFS